MPKTARRYGRKRTKKKRRITRTRIHLSLGNKALGKLDEVVEWKEGTRSSAVSWLSDLGCSLKEEMEKGGKVFVQRADGELVYYVLPPVE